MSEAPAVYEVAAAQAAIEADRQRRAAEFAAILREAGERLRVEVVAEPRIVDGRIVAVALIVAQ